MAKRDTDKRDLVIARSKKGDVVILRRESVNKGKGGRPRLILTEEGLRMVESMASIGCTIEEICAAMDVGRATLTSTANRDVFRNAYERGREAQKTSIRKAQAEIMKKGSAQMAIFLGKNVLGQSDRSEMVLTEKRPEEMDIEELAAVLRKVKKGKS